MPVGPLGAGPGRCATSPITESAGWAAALNGTSHEPSTPYNFEARFQVTNNGPDAHELIVVRLGDRPIPLRADGTTVNEEALKSSIVGTLEPGASGSIRLLAVGLTPGRYVVMCNMEGHYMGGMHHEFVVAP